MVFARTVDCDRIDEDAEPSILWKLPLLFLALVLQQQSHNPRLELFGGNLNDPESNKWKPSLPTILEEQDAPTIEEIAKETPKAAFATWQTALVWSAVWFLSFRKQQSLLDVLVIS